MPIRMVLARIFGGVWQQKRQKACALLTLKIICHHERKKIFNFPQLGSKSDERFPLSL